MASGAVMGWRAAAADSFLPYRIGGALVGTFFGGGAAIPFVASNFAAAFLALWLTRGQSFTAQFTTFAAIASVLTIVVLNLLDQGLRQMGGRHLDPRTLAIVLALLIATFALALVLMRYAPTHRAG